MPPTKKESAACKCDICGIFVNDVSSSNSNTCKTVNVDEFTANELNFLENLKASYAKRRTRRRKNKSQKGNNPANSQSQGPNPPKKRNRRRSGKGKPTGKGEPTGTGSKSQIISESLLPPTPGPPKETLFAEGNIVQDVATGMLYQLKLS